MKTKCTREKNGTINGTRMRDSHTKKDSVNAKMAIKYLNRCEQERCMNDLDSCVFVFLRVHICKLFKRKLINSLTALLEQL